MNGKTGNKDRTILIVDDVPEDIIILEEILKADYRVKAVTTGSEALRVARGPEPPDLILLDIMMPGMDGFEVCRELKKDSDGAAIPVIFLTAKVMRTDEKAGLELGAVDYIRKPVDPEIVKSRVRSHLEQKDRLLRISEVRYRRLFETAKDGIVILDAQAGVVLDVNPAMAAIMGTTQEAFLGRKADDLEFLRVIAEQHASLPKSRQGVYVRYRDVPLSTFDGRHIYVDFVENSYEVDRRQLRQINVREVTALVAAERERDTLAARLAHYLYTSPTVTYSLKIEGGSTRWQWVSENVLAVLGYTSEEALAPNWWFENVSSLDRAGALGIVSDLMRRGTASREYRFARKDRSVAWLHDEMRYLAGPDSGSEVVGTLTDISEKKKAEEEILLKSAALDAAANAVVITNRAGVIRWANAAFATLSGYDLAEIVGKTPKQLVWSGRQDAEFYRGLWGTILSGKVWDGVLVNRRKGGEEYDERMTITPVLDDRATITHFVAIKTDITETVAARRRLETAVRQKEVLLREVHHRVNNNMQVIISLLNLSGIDIGDELLDAKFKDIIRRVHTMAIIHEQFCETEDLSKVDLTILMGRLVEGLEAEFPLHSRRIRVGGERGRIFLNLERAIPVGLIVTELLTNSLKHAFPEGREKGAVSVAQRIAADGRLEIEVRDDGIGLPEGVDLASAQSMGMMLMRILSHQILGELEFLDGPGTAARLSLPAGDGTD